MPPLPAGPTGGPPPPQILVSIAHLEEDLAEIEAFRPLLARVHAEVELTADEPPRACRSGVIDELAGVVRRGAQLVSSDAGSLRRDLEDLCERFERWRAPDEGRRNRIRGYVTRLDRIDEWMRDIQRCVHPGPYDFRCENAYGPQEPGDAEQARAAMAVVAEVRRALGGVPDRRRFPCRSTVWDRVENRTWTLSVARAQIPGLARQARSICESLGVDVPTLTEKVQRIRDRVDRADASMVQLGNSRRSSVLQLRTTFGLPPSPP
jgi:hypothetical protein